ncbi:glycoside hydrolase family 43 protein [Flavobacterium sp. IB48]|uniref:glycoside hydrolase family 43 protein n=1 Tax=Flavobacterium sp. IB48 TaxID=2779375 RepID=UPI0018E6F6BA|nr:glycoside hydrolase family 43 protein [Flavobacterium sp. IB48]MBJ2127265.1 glycoside hydrolase family 43 protein [Flavobacterium sp. IB48]
MNSDYAVFDYFHYEGKDQIYKTITRTNDNYFNPILSGFYPDPSICRVGNKFYLVNSSFSYFPGLPIFESEDLVNWKQIGHVIDRKEQANFTLAISKGMYAPTIRCHDGTFYVVCTNVDAGGNFIVTAKNPAGPWSNPIWFPNIDGIDPDIFFDDNGKVYITHNGPPPNNISVHGGHRAIYMFEYDIKNFKIIGEPKLVINGGTNMAEKPVWIEGPHIIKKDGFYYMICAQGGTEYRHTEVVFRSKNIFGPYESYEMNPILTQKNLDPNRKNQVTTTGHADFIQLPNGEWWSVFLGCRPYGDDLYNTGRETFMLPVEWKNGWPEITGGNEPIPFIHKRPNLPLSRESVLPMNGNFISDDEFDSDKLDFKWNFVRTPSEKWHELKDGKLFVKARKESIKELVNFSFIGRRQQHLQFDISTKVSFDLKGNKATAGLAAFQNEKNYLLLGIRLNAENKQEIYLEKATNEVNEGKSEIVRKQELLSSSKALFFRIEGEAQYFTFYYKTNQDDNWKVLAENVDASILSTKKAGGFVGTYLGMYASSNHF